MGVNIPPSEIIQITGHKILQSVNNYSAKKQQENISSILSASSTTTTTATQPMVSRQVSKFSAASEIQSYHATHPEFQSVPADQLSSSFLGNHITGGTFNVHVSTTSSLASSSTLIGESPKRKKYRRVRVLDSDSSQSGNSQE